jgi:hypothetical protein
VARKKPRNLHDRAFKALFSPPEAALPILRASLPPALMDAIDPGSLTPEPTTFVNDELDEDHRDLLFSATIRGRHVLLYVIEHQSTVVRFMALRLLRYVLKVWDWWLASHPDAKTLPAVIPVVLHQGRKAWDGPRSLAELIDLPPELRDLVGRYVPGLDFALQDLGPASSAELAAFPGPPLVRVTLCFMRAVTDPAEDPLAALDVLAAALRELLGQPGGPARLAVVLRYTVLARPEFDVRDIADAFRRVAGPEAGEVVMSTAERLIDQGVQQGVQQGQRELLEMLLREKFGKLAQPVLARLAAATTDELKTWAKRLVSARDGARSPRVCLKTSNTKTLMKLGSVPEVVTEPARLALHRAVRQPAGDRAGLLPLGFRRERHRWAGSGSGRAHWGYEPPATALLRWTCSIRGPVRALAPPEL